MIEWIYYKYRSQGTIEGWWLYVNKLYASLVTIKVCPFSAGDVAHLVFLYSNKGLV